MRVYFRNKSMHVNAIKCGIFRKAFGLMFRTKKTDNLLFEFNNDVKISLTSLFVFFPFLVLWLDDRNRVIEYRIIKPFVFKINAKNNFRKIVEIPINEKNKEIVRFFVGNTEKFK